MFYSVNDQLWQYDLLKQRAQLIANMPLGGVISGGAITPDQNYIYLSVGGGSSANLSIRRVGLKGQAVPKFVYQLQSIIPRSIGQCSLNLVNFSHTSVTFTPASPACQQAAAAELRQDGFDVGQLSLTPASL
jgi:hypothetical protein